MPDRRWYVNTATGQVAQGKLWPDTCRLGPYATREDAEDAWATVEERNRAWDEDDREWRRWYDDDAQ
ncbi:hypothetical protein [Bifidobacterium phasiani]|uniref:SPOR domain-containing protein n=1 Tax=Bifidobacterium phasiani TaxID=2834431 RepID=A0ABS6W955_9BIFI|nr:hypothetical protein [Bifidobacterium phasiani]MBW3082276.1 hypothetical protein [Bifidobacterium phasiani]